MFPRPNFPLLLDFHTCNDSLGPLSRVPVDSCELTRCLSYHRRRDNFAVDQNCHPLANLLLRGCMNLPGAGRVNCDQLENVPLLKRFPARGRKHRPQSLPVFGISDLDCSSGHKFMRKESDEIGMNDS